MGEAMMDDSKHMHLESVDGVESVLGMKWIPEEDCFTYSLAVRDNLQELLNDSRVPTKREVLRIVMSLFDPLGLISFVLIHGRILMQNIWASGAKWDDSINDSLFHQWRSWIDLLPCLETLRIPRSYFSFIPYDGQKELQLHVFVDASASAYAAVAYFRLETTNGIQVALVGSKTKVAPLKMISIPRLELLAAVLGCRLLNNICSNHTLLISKRHLWTDSSTVMAWIQSKQRKYSQFVAFRVGEILATTNIDEWRWVPSKNNVADEATKWGKGPNVSGNNRWFRGPDFLCQLEERWSPPSTFITNTEELAAVNYHEQQHQLIEFERFSRWERLIRTLAYVHRFVENIRNKQSGEPLELGAVQQKELIYAEQKLWMQAQVESFQNEIAVLWKTRGSPDAFHPTVAKSSTIFKRWPFIDQYGTLRMRGRIEAASWATFDAKYPVILPRKHYVTFLIADWYHRQYRHANQETVINEIRQRFEIPKLRVLPAKVKRQCMVCRIRGEMPQPPPLGPLPDVRLETFVRPFTYVGLDYYGPLLVRVKRSNVKRWVALFTCLTIRAIHLEVVHSLSTESCVMAVRRFVARRGAPVEIFSDNGTNFKGAHRQLTQEIKMRNQTLSSIFTNTNTRWNFNPPAAPHMGGVWERLVRSVKVAMEGLLDARRKPDDESLETILLETEAMINTRPLTYIPLESAD
ncbi:uncharacterized protein LOC131426176 [Malaya genurostris]|uniref:uncharacterized protein LOC131426176 n=1 Tax=Malaya genurostris TaxID=325434 RepID=UPI0026F3E613|nr:uncharacterized protein LOC131426176 [Malaya genurostris]